MSKSVQDVVFGWGFWDGSNGQPSLEQEFVTETNRTNYQFGYLAALFQDNGIPANFVKSWDSVEVWEQSERDLEEAIELESVFGTFNREAFFAECKRQDEIIWDLV